MSGETAEISKNEQQLFLVEDEVKSIECIQMIVKDGEALALKIGALEKLTAIVRRFISLY